VSERIASAERFLHTTSGRKTSRRDRHKVTFVIIDPLDAMGGRVGNAMTAPMIEWTLEILEWVRAQLFENWPEAQLRGSAPDLDPEPYRIRFRDKGKVFWLTLLPPAICNTAVSDVTSLLESEDWIRLMQDTGQVSVGVQEHTKNAPALILS